MVSIYYEDDTTEDRLRREAVAFLDAEIQRIRFDGMLQDLVDGWRFDDGLPDWAVL